MTEEQGGRRIRKGELTQQRIVESALRLFVSKGYEQTTMRDIAAAAGYSPGLTYRYFTCKEELVMVLYQNLADELDTYVRSLPLASLTERFHATVAKQLELMAPHRETLGALFGTTFNPRSKAGVFGESTADIRWQARGTYLAIITGARDAPRASQREALATVLYGAHLAMVLFWLIDQSAETQQTQKLLDFLRDMLKLLQPILWLPVVSPVLARLARIIGPLLGADEQFLQQDTQEKDKKKQ